MGNDKILEQLVAIVAEMRELCAVLLVSNARSGWTSAGFRCEVCSRRPSEQ
ncbi:MAG: hypothetical protein QOD95_3400, partial [Gammaproteobacteria bacterium]|nr:hypothetical protein [Gammaproteobacteria bacterium]